MFRIDLGPTPRYCDGVNRRSFLQLGLAGMAGFGAARHCCAPSRDRQRRQGYFRHPDLARRRPQPSRYVRHEAGRPGRISRPLEADSAPACPASTSPNCIPKQAKVTDKFSIVRSLHHNTGDHFAGGHRMLTAKDMGVSGANNAGKLPGIGAIVDREVGARKRGMPAYVGAPHAASIGLVPGYFGGNFLGAQHNPFQPGGDPNAANFQVRQPEPGPGLSIGQLEDRRGLVSALRQMTRTHLDGRRNRRAMDRFAQEAFEFISGPTARRAFDIGLEDPRLRDRYGRHNWGQSTLLARRLVEAGCTFVAVHFGGWDHHWDLQKGYEANLPMVDSGRRQPVRGPGRARLAGKDAGGAVRRVQPDAEDERRRQRRPGRQHGYAGPRPLGRRDVLPDGRRRRQGRPDRRLDRPAGDAADQPARDAVEHSRHHLSRPRHRPDAATADPTGRPTPVLDDPTAIEELL